MGNYTRTPEHRKKMSERLKGRKFSEEHKKHLTEARIGEKNHFYGKKHTEETKEKMRKSSPHLSGKNHPKFGKHSSPESIAKQIETKRQRGPSMRQIIATIVESSGNTYWEGKKHTEETKEKMRIAQLGEKHHQFGKPIPIEQKEKMRIAQIGKHDGSKNPMFGKRGRLHPGYGKPLSFKTRLKLRIHSLKRFLRTGKMLNIGTNEKTLLDKQEKIDNCKIIRQYPLTDIGYVVDGYCPETNTVYEVYEKYHNKQVQKDFERENEICNHLFCDFVIIWDRS